MTTDVNGITLHWERAGSGEPLLWLHGAMGSGADWRFIFREPPDGFEVIAPDLRGHGASTNPGGAFTFRDAARDVLALMREAGVTRTKAIGLSGGGIVLLHMATMAPDLIEAMVLVSAPPYFPEQARRIQRQFSAAMLSAADLDRMRAVHARGEPQIEQLYSMVRAFADTYDDVCFTPPQLSTITSETLIVFGDRDPLYPLSLAMQLKEAIPRSYLWVVPNGGHGPVFGDAAEPFAATALAFLKGAWGGDRRPKLR
jgi:pimeloyl-ACP methyl ester carboxylesterase